MIINNSALPALSKMPDNCIDMVFTSPSPIFFEHNNIDKMTEDEKIETIGAEENSYDYVIHLMDIFDEVKRVLKPKGSCFVNMADYYYRSALEFIPWLFSLNMINNKHQWYCPAQLSWHRPFTKKEIKHKHKKGFVKDIDYLFQFTHHPTDYNFNMPNNKLWWQSSLINYEIEKIASNSFESGFPQKMVEMAINATILNTPPSTNPALILDIFAGSGTTGAAAKKLGHRYIMIDINRSYCEGMMARLGDMEITR